MTDISLPPGFFLGASTAAYQIEGGNFHSDFWDWEGRKGWERSGPAVDSWNRFDEDLSLMRYAGLNAYRFSIEWARIFPSEGTPDFEALSRYALQAERLREAGIEPMICLHHFTNPAWLMRKYPGGWSDPAVVKIFLDFVQIVVKKLSGKTRWWMSFNEPNVYAMQSHVVGHFPPGHLHIFDWRKRLAPALRHIAQAHRGAYALIKEADPLARVGIVPHIDAVEPYEDRASHRAAAKRWDEFFHWSLMDDLAAHLDFIGLNYYTRVFVKPLPFLLSPVHALPLYSEIEMVLPRWFSRFLGTRRGRKRRDDMGHEMHPEGLTGVLEALQKRYGKPVLITENGAASDDGAFKADWAAAHLEAALSAKGVNLLGFLYWSLMDNYEWGSYRYRFGMFQVDRSGGFKRTPTEAAEFFRRIKVSA